MQSIRAEREITGGTTVSIDERDPKIGPQEKGTGAEKTPPSGGAELPGPIGRRTQIVCFGERVTYTFLYGDEVGSIHFDRLRGEIFYKGHSLRHMELEESHWQMLEKMRQMLKLDSKARRFAEPYGKVLDKITLERKKAKPSSP
jgi:hypothetical protein